MRSATEPSQINGKYNELVREVGIMTYRNSYWEYLPISVYPIIRVGFSYYFQILPSFLSDCFSLYVYKLEATILDSIDTLELLKTFLFDHVHSVPIRLAATNALLNSLEFTKQNFEREV